MTSEHRTPAGSESGKKAFGNNTESGSLRSLSISQSKLLNLFFYIAIGGILAAMLGIILYYVYAFASLYYGSENFDWLLGIFSDFVDIMNASLKDSPYVTDGTSYPPVAVMVLLPFALICKKVFAAYSGIENLTVDELTSRVILHPEFWIALVLFFAICISAILFIIIKKYQLTGKAAIKMAVIVIFSAPFVYAIMRGNTIYFALVFTLLFLLLYDHPRAWVREISYFCLVFAGLIKIYPLFFGVFLLKKKKFFASARIGIYFAILFFLSFHLFKLGLDGMDPFINNLSGFMFSDDRWLSLRNLSASSLLYKLVYIFSPAATETSAFQAVNLTVLLLIFATATVTAIATRSHFSRSVIAAAVVILVPTISYFYVLIFEIIPFMEFLKDYDSMPIKKRRIFTLFFLFLFMTAFVLPQCFIPHSLIVIAMLVIEERSVFRNEIMPWLHNKKAIRAQS